VLLGSALLGAIASIRWLIVLVAGVAGLVLLQQPSLGFFAIVVLSMVVPFEIGTGTEVRINLSTLLVPGLVLLWLLNMMRRQAVKFAPSRTNRPLLFFLLAGLLSLLIGAAYWDPAVPRSDNLIIVQLAQWGIFAFSAGIFWLAGNEIQSEVVLKRLTFVYLGLAGGLAMWWVAADGNGLVYQVTTLVLQRAPFWMLLSAMACGQLFFNEKLPAAWRWFLMVVMAAATFFCLFQNKERSSNWVGLAVSVGMLVWLRWPRWRRALAVAAVVGGIALFPRIYEFAGGDTKWDESGGSRLALIGRVVEVTLRNPITGLGPAAYRSYARMEPLLYQGAYWLDPQINSHNNYVDLFAHVGLLGLGLLTWFFVEMMRLGVKLRDHYTTGFAAGYVNGALAAGVGALAIMALADWILPHVYNIGFPGFQASVLVWLFWGGLVALEQGARKGAAGR
jgi:hypothetical protein